MTERQIANRVKKLQELEAQQAELGKQIDALKKEIQSVMTDHEEITACNFVIRWCKVITNQLDTTRIKKELPDLYRQYCKESYSRRFSISAL